MSFSFNAEQRLLRRRDAVRLPIASILFAMVPLLFLAGCATDETYTAQQPATPSCLTGIDDSNWLGPTYSADDLAWFNVPGNFTQFAATCQTAAVTALIIGAQYHRGDSGTADVMQAVAWWKKAAALGDAEADNQLGYAYSDFLSKPMRNEQTAFQWYSRGAAGGNQQATENTALMYLNGQGVAANRARAAGLLLKLSNAGDHYAQLQLGYCYENGWGVPRNKYKARHWFLQAWNNGSGYDGRDEIAKLGLSTTESRNPTEEEATAQTTSQSDWQQDHQAKIDELTQEIANHEQQAQQDDANADEAEAQAEQNANANVGGPGGAFLALGNAVEGGTNAGLAEKERQDAADERQQAREEREQLAELGAEQPPVAQNNSETMALTQMQTQAIRSGNTIEGQVNRERNNIQGARQQEAPVVQPEPETPQQSQAAAQQQSASSGGDVIYAQPAMQCLTYTAAGQYEGVGVWATNSCSYEIEMSWATPSAPATGIIFLNAGERIFVPHQPVKVFACTVVKGNAMNGNIGIYKTFDAATGQSTPPTYGDPSFVCPVNKS